MSAGVSPATRQRLREAMQRLFNGRPLHTDGTLTKNNLWREAQVSRATMNRAADILAEWDARAGDSPTGLAVRRRDEQLEKLRERLRASTLERRTLQAQLDAAATVIAALHTENTALRRQATDASSHLVPFRRRPGWEGPAQ
ncbi:hypothetical protein Aph02nite_79420 [Actinoplanes philippinensis]|uniref:Uncharacterized protein n=1 Tax=Actinoplanes philippinensis TaxID=35752 RepID=A0A1I2KDZ0_9ACTN|nr:hypothetical protein [Actinoplanes philippinensis]GIE81992.1 hypothetical protein Aph02nite_79420 [Actinoplanes philippinensis]SFF65262.1 hypothetical protein SAMN05421541_116167 [Actinoplanes philippinensis]